MLRGALLILEGRDAGRIVPIAKTPFRIGRALDNELVLADEQVSRQHAFIHVGQTGFTIEDQRSRNGLFVNTERVERHTLTVGDRVRIGGTVLVFQKDVGEAREVLADSIPDSPAFAMDPIQESEVEEPTAIRALVDLESQGIQSSTRALTQSVKLFTSNLAQTGVAVQILDIVFQGFLPERTQLTWSPDIQMARSRQEGRKTQSIELTEELREKAKRGAILIKEEVPVPHGKGSEERLVLLAPLKVGPDVRGWLYADRLSSQPSYSSRDLEHFDSMAVVAGALLQRSTLLQETKSLRKQIQLMERHLSPDVVQMLADRGVSIEESMLSVERREVTVLFSDIQGFTPLSERLPPEELAALLNEYFQRQVDVILAHRGELNKFIGDAIMALFGAPRSYGDDAANAVAAGLAMVESLQNFWAEIDEKKRFNIRIGINTGFVVAGNIGSEKKMEYTVLGDPVNLASRLEGISLPNTVTIGERTRELVKDRFKLEVVEGVKVKGKSQEMRVYRVLGYA